MAANLHPMKPQKLTLTSILLLTCLPALLAATGCAVRRSSSAPLARTIDTAAQRVASDEMAIRQFERQRNDAEFEAARLCLRRGDEEGCWTRLEQLLAHCPDYCEARLLMAELMTAADRSAEAIAQLRRAVADHPEDARAQFALARLLDRTGQTKEAIIYYEKTLQLQPDDEQYLQGYREALVASRGDFAPYGSIR